MEKTQSGYPDELNQNNEASISESRSGSGKSTGRRSAGTKKRRKSVRTDGGRFLIAKLLALVCLVLVVFEGNVIYRLFSHQVGTSVEIMNSGNDAQTEGLLQDSADPDVAVSTKEASSTSGGNASVVALAGGGSDDVLPESPSTDSTPAVQSSEYIESSKVVPQRDPAVDDSYFNNAVFIGDSRMEGFRNSSGITQGTFLTGVGLSVADMGRQIIAGSLGLGDLQKTPEEIIGNVSLTYRTSLLKLELTFPEGSVPPAGTAITLKNEAKSFYNRIRLYWGEPFYVANRNTKGPIATVAGTPEGNTLHNWLCIWAGDDFTGSIIEVKDGETTWSATFEPKEAPQAGKLYRVRRTLSAWNPEAGGGGITGGGYTEK